MLRFKVQRLTELQNRLTSCWKQEGISGVIAIAITPGCSLLQNTWPSAPKGQMPNRSATSCRLKRKNGVRTCGGLGWQGSGHASHSAFEGQAPDEMYFATGADVPEKLQAAPYRKFNTLSTGRCNYRTVSRSALPLIFEQMTEFSLLDESKFRFQNSRKMAAPAIIASMLAPITTFSSACRELEHLSS